MQDVLNFFNHLDENFLQKRREFLVVFCYKKIPYVDTRDICPSVRPSVCLSSVEISLERGFRRSAEPIDLKIG